MSARVLTAAELAQLLRAQGLPAGPEAHLVALLVPAAALERRRFAWPAGFDCGVLEIVRGLELSTAVAAIWRKA